jgi:hypothetical protein
VRWADIQSHAPRLGRVCDDRLIGPGVLLVVTIRLDGTPRLSPVEPFVLDGDLWLSMMWQSRKAMDLIRDDRLLVHSVIADRDGGQGEVKLRGRALAVDDLAIRARYCAAVAVLGWQPKEPSFHLFRVDIDDVTVIRYHHNGDQQVARWPEGVEFRRRETSPTSVGPPEEIVELLAPDSCG